MGSIKEGEWSCHRGGQFNRERICYGGGHFNGARMIILERWSVSWVENNVMEAGLMEGVWSCYRGGQFNGGRMVMLRRWPV